MHTYFAGQSRFAGVKPRLVREISGGTTEVNSFILHPVRHIFLRSDLPPLLRADIKVLDDEKYWNAYIEGGYADFLVDQRPEEVRHAILSSICRAYVAEVMDAFVSEFEQLAPGLVVPEYDLEKGSIKETLAVMASVATIAGGAMTTVAGHPEAREAWPVLKMDAQIALVKAKLVLQKRLRAAKIELETKSGNRSPTRTSYPTIGPAIAPRREENFDEAS